MSIRQVSIFNLLNISYWKDQTPRSKTIPSTLHLSIPFLNDYTYILWWFFALKYGANCLILICEQYTVWKLENILYCLYTFLLLHTWWILFTTSQCGETVKISVRLHSKIFTQCMSKWHSMMFYILLVCWNWRHKNNTLWHVKITHKIFLCNSTVIYLQLLSFHCHEMPSTWSTLLCIVE